MVALGRSAAFYYQQRLDEAAAMAAHAEQGFSHLGDIDRRMDALYLRAGIKFEAGSLSEAATLFRQVIDHGELLKNSRWLALGLSALGKCEVQRGNLKEASMYLHKALALFRQIGPEYERLTAEWALAQVLLKVGKLAEASRRLRDIAAEFERRGLVTDAALVGLDVADALLGLGQAQRIVDLATRLFRVFTNAGMLTGALTAIAYIKEGAASGTLTSSDVQTVRSFLRRAERQPEMLFVPPPTRIR
jgi:tetratricopeptide (TPR) repeat protein